MEPYLYNRLIIDIIVVTDKYRNVLPVRIFCLDIATPLSEDPESSLDSLSACSGSTCEVRQPQWGIPMIRFETILETSQERPCSGGW